MAGPVEGTTTDTAADLTTDIGGGIGDCMTDTFAVSSNGALGSPVICGVNSGQHSEHCYLPTLYYDNVENGIFSDC